MAQQHWLGAAFDHANVASTIAISSSNMLDRSHSPEENLQQCNSTEAYLINLTTTLIEFMNARAYTHPFFLQHVSPDVYVNLQGKATRGLEAYIGNYKADANGSPSFQVCMDNYTALVDETMGTGTVIISQYLSKYRSDGRRMAGTILMSWNRIDGVWVNVSVYMILGTPEFLDYS